MKDFPIGPFICREMGRGSWLHKKMVCFTESLVALHRVGYLYRDTGGFIEIRVILQKDWWFPTDTWVAL